jgi:hypothetical protein
MTSSWIAKADDASLPAECLQAPVARVAVIPNHPSALDNRLFSPDYVINAHWMSANIYWRNYFRDRGVALDTYDITPLEKASAAILFDLPDDIDTVIEWKRRLGNRPLILILQESPVDRPHWFNSYNHRFFDYVLTYNPRLLSQADKYLRYFYPSLTVQHPGSNPGFSQRKLAVMINTNHYSGFRASPRPWSLFAKYLSLYRKGWRFTPKSIITTHLNTAYSKRRRLGRAADDFTDSILDIYGSGWCGRKSGWFYRIFQDKPYKANNGPLKAEKLGLISSYRFSIAFENYVGNEGYISEKILDAFQAGSVPVYLGDKSINDIIPDNCFVDARHFKDYRELFLFLSNITEAKWSTMRSNGLEFLGSRSAYMFSPRYFSELLFHVALGAAK